MFFCEKVVNCVRSPGKRQSDKIAGARPARQPGWLVDKAGGKSFNFFRRVWRVKNHRSAGVAAGPPVTFAVVAKKISSGILCA
jgi:hypothetical protein